MRRRLRLGLRRLDLRSEKGQTFVLVAAAFPLILAIAAIVIDGTRLFVAHQQTQNAADAASLAAGRDLPAAGCTSTPMTCPASVQTTASQYSQYNGGPPINHACVGSSDSNCWMTPVPIRDNNGVVHSENIVQVRITENRNGFFANAIGAGSLFHVKAVAAATPGSFTIINTTPGTTSPGSTTVLTSTTLQTSTTGGAPAIMFAFGVWYPNEPPSLPACNPGGGLSINMSGDNNVFHGSIWSNGGVGLPGNNNGAPAGDPNGEGFLFYQNPPCGTPGPKPWIGQETPKTAPIFWPVALPVLTCSGGTIGTTCPAGDIVTAVTDDKGNVKSCTNEGANWNAPDDLPAGVYCASQKINAGGDQKNGAAFIAPQISIPAAGSGTTSQFIGYQGLYTTDGGLLFDGYGNPTAVQSSTHGASVKGAIFGPTGAVNVPGGGTTLACSGSNSCGFIEAVAINFPSNGSTYQGLGPPIGGTVSTTTILTSTTVTLPGTTIGGSTGTTTLGTNPSLRQ